MKYQDLINKMTLEEKAAFLGGKGEWQTWDFPRLGIPEMYLSDGPSGVRRQAGAGDHLGLNPSLPATCVPSAATVASSWDISLAEEIGKTLGEEAMCENVQILLGPGMNMKRSPLCGRNFEYYSEDPYLAGKIASGYIKGVQSQGVRACAKHFAVNSQEERRMAVNAVVDERTLREIYLTQFEISVKEGGVKALMTSYNELNGEYTNENKHLLKDILRGEWGYDGMVVTDWGGSNSHVAGVKASRPLTTAPSRWRSSTRESTPSSTRSSRRPRRPKATRRSSTRKPTTTSPVGRPPSARSFLKMKTTSFPLRRAPGSRWSAILPSSRAIRVQGPPQSIIHSLKISPTGSATTRRTSKSARSSAATRETDRTTRS